MVREGADPAQKQRNPLVCGLRGRARMARFNGVDEDRTHNLLDATEALFQLSYHPQQSGFHAIRRHGVPQGDETLRWCCVSAVDL